MIYTVYGAISSVPLDEVTEMINSGFAEITYRIFKAEDTFKRTVYKWRGISQLLSVKKFDTAGLSLLDEVLPLAARTILKRRV